MTSFCNVCVTRRGNTTAAAPLWRELEPPPHRSSVASQHPPVDGSRRHAHAPADPAPRVGGHVDKAIQAMSQRLGEATNLPSRRGSPSMRHFSDVTSQIHEEDKSSMDFIASLRHQNDSGCGGAAATASGMASASEQSYVRQAPWKPWSVQTQPPAAARSLSPRLASSAARSDGRAMGALDNVYHHRTDSPGVRHAITGARSGVAASLSSRSSSCGVCHCQCHPSLRKLESDVATMSEYVDLIRAGFLDLCEAVRADVHDVHTEMDGRFHRQEQRLLEAVRNAVRQEGRYHELLERERQDTIGRAYVTSHVDKVRTAHEESVQDLYKQLQRLELRLDASEKVYHHRQDESREKALRSASASGVSGGENALEHHQTIRNEMASVSTHVHALTGAHQQLIQTVVDERCAKVEHQLRLEVDKVGVQLAELRSRINSQHRELREHHYLTCSQASSLAPAPPTAASSM